MNYSCCYNYSCNRCVTVVVTIIVTKEHTYCYNHVYYRCVTVSVPQSMYCIIALLYVELPVVLTIFKFISPLLNVVLTLFVFILLMIGRWTMTNPPNDSNLRERYNKVQRILLVIWWGVRLGWCFLGRATLAARCMGFESFENFGYNCNLPAVVTNCAGDITSTEDTRRIILSYRCWFHKSW